VSGPLPVTFALTAPRVWTGAAGRAWDTAGSWNPAGVPQVGDSVLIAATSTQPTLSAAVTISGLRVEPGARLDTRTFQLTVQGHAVVDGMVTSAGAGRVLLSGTAHRVRGRFQSLVVAPPTGQVTLAGFTQVDGRLELQGVLVVGPESLRVGSLLAAGSGVLLMADGNGLVVVDDDLDLSNNTTFCGNSPSNLRAGVLEVGGNLRLGSCATFSSGTHVLRLAPSQPATVTGGSSNGWTVANLELGIGARVTLPARTTVSGSASLGADAELTTSGRLDVVGQLTVGDRGVLSSAELSVGGNVSTANGGLVSTTTLRPAANNSIGASVVFQDLLVASNGTLSRSVDVPGQLRIDSASLDLGGHTLTVLGNAESVGTGNAYFRNANSTLDVRGNLTIAGNGSWWYSGEDVGRIRVRGNLDATSTGLSIQTGVTVELAPGASAQPTLRMLASTGRTLGSLVVARDTTLIAPPSLGTPPRALRTAGDLVLRPGVTLQAATPQEVEARGHVRLTNGAQLTNLSGLTTAGSLTLAPGATVRTTASPGRITVGMLPNATGTLDAAGPLRLGNDQTPTSTTGTTMPSERPLNLSGTASFTRLEIDVSTVLSASASIPELRLEGGSLDLGGQTLTVLGNAESVDGGTAYFRNASSILDVRGNLTIGGYGAWWYANNDVGRIRVRGNLDVSSTAANIQTGVITEILSGGISNTRLIRSSVGNARLGTVIIGADATWSGTATNAGFTTSGPVTVQPTATWHIQGSSTLVNVGTSGSSQSLTNQGTIVNDGTLRVHGAFTGNAPQGSGTCLEGSGSGVSCN